MKKIKKNRKKIRKGLSKFDLFGQTIAFTFNGEGTYKTACGGIVSICIVIVFMILLTIKSRELL